ncbi:GFA family protein [Paraglaciecola sp.]|uniref:GFA family protein n=1 Tax=Paraglaciecola sp. TaxID=1920173 RepID=UPI0032678B80
MSEKITGGCLCGKVTFEVNNSFTRFYFCHCQQCQKITGSAHAANSFTTPDAIKWISGQRLTKQYDDPDRDFTVVFCSECGSGLPFVTKTSKTLIVPAGSLNEDPNIHPNDNIFWAERASWYDEGTNANPCAGFPS